MPFEFFSDSRDATDLGASGASESSSLSNSYEEKTSF
jgi:hypothetical protein